MKWTLALTLLLASAVEAKTFEQCGVRFDYPDNWTSVANPAGLYDRKLPTRCTAGLRPPGWRRKMKTSKYNLPPFPVYVLLVDRPFLTVTKRAGFMSTAEWGKAGWSEDDVKTRFPDGWSIAVRQGDAPATAFRIPCCRGVLGQTWGHGTAKDGSKTSETEDLAVLNDSHGHSVLISASGEEFADEFQAIFDRLIATFQFVTR